MNLSLSFKNISQNLQVLKRRTSESLEWKCKNLHRIIINFYYSFHVILPGLNFFATSMWTATVSWNGKNLRLMWLKRQICWIRDWNWQAFHITMIAPNLWTQVPNIVTDMIFRKWLKYLHCASLQWWWVVMKQFIGCYAAAVDIFFFVDRKTIRILYSFSTVVWEST